MHVVHDKCKSLLVNAGEVRQQKSLLIMVFLGYTPNVH